MCDEVDEKVCVMRLEERSLRDELVTKIFV